MLVCILRIGLGNSSIDNSSTGGIFVDYNIEENKLGKVAYTFFKHGGKSFYQHPDSGVKFEDFELPYPEKVKNIVKKAALLIDKEILGWDIAYTPQGAIIIEVNQSPNHTTQIMNKNLLTNNG